MCNEALGFWNPSRECSISRMVCCRKCCNYVMEPRLDGDLHVTKAFSIELLFGHEPIAIEHQTREKLLARWAANKEPSIGDIFEEEEEEEVVVVGAPKTVTHIQRNHKHNKSEHHHNDYIDIEVDLEDEVIMEDLDLMTELSQLKREEGISMTKTVSKLYQKEDTYENKKNKKK